LSKEIESSEKLSELKKKQQKKGKEEKKEEKKDNKGKKKKPFGSILENYNKTSEEEKSIAKFNLKLDKLTLGYDSEIKKTFSIKIEPPIEQKEEVLTKNEKKKDTKVSSAKGNESKLKKSDKMLEEEVKIEREPLEINLKLSLTRT
jgi:hypothetical protein